MNIPLENLEILQKNLNELKKENQELKDTNMKYAKLIDDFQTKNMLLEKVFSDLKSMFEIKIGIDTGNEYFMEIKQLDDRIAELIPKEDIEIFKEVLRNE